MPMHMLCLSSQKTWETPFLTTRSVLILRRFACPEEWIGLPYDDTDSIVLHRFFNKHTDKVGKGLLSLSRPSEANTSAVNGKRAWDNLCAALVDPDSSIPPPQPSTLDSSSLEGFRCGH